jgi:DNA repair ATPase RecN
VVVPHRGGLTSVSVENYESIESADLELGAFTVITGPTSSGKSALIRAVRLLAFNARGTDYIRHGQTTCKVGTGVAEEGWVVGIERGGRGKDAYRLVPDGHDLENVEVYTKLGGKVPEAVSARLRLSELNFAGQFDSPYLLDASGGQVAKTLGELTNVTVVLDAASRAQSLKRSINAELKAATAERDRLAAQVRAYDDIEDEAARLEEAQRALERATAAAAARGRLETLLGNLRSALASREAARAALEQATVPDFTALEECTSRLNRLRQLHLTLVGAIEARAHFTEALAAAAREERAAQEGLHATLVSAGRCPTCGQETADVELQVS